MAQEVKVTKVLPYSNYAVVEWPENRHFKWVACWSPWIVEKDYNDNRTERRPNLDDYGKTVQMYWGQGHYFQNIEDALLYALDRETEAFESHIKWLEDSI